MVSFQQKKRNRIPFTMQLIYHRNDRLSNQITTKTVDFLKKSCVELGCPCFFCLSRLCESWKRAKDNRFWGELTSHAGPCRRILPVFPQRQQAESPRCGPFPGINAVRRSGSLRTAWFQYKYNKKSSLFCSSFYDLNEIVSYGFRATIWNPLASIKEECRDNKRRITVCVRNTTTGKQSNV